MVGKRRPLQKIAQRIQVTAHAPKRRGKNLILLLHSEGGGHQMDLILHSVESVRRIFVQPVQASTEFLHPSGACFKVLISSSQQSGLRVGDCASQLFDHNAGPLDWRSGMVRFFSHAILSSSCSIGSKSISLGFTFSLPFRPRTSRPPSEVLWLVSRELKSPGQVTGGSFGAERSSAAILCPGSLRFRPRAPASVQARRCCGSCLGSSNRPAR